MKPEPLSIELQRAYVQAWKRCGPIMDEMRADEARARTEAEKWMDAQDVQFAGEDRALARRPVEDFEQHGLVIQQRYFMRLHRR